MRKWIAWLCLLALACAQCTAALAEPVVYTGESGFTITLPDDWVSLFGDYSGEDEENEEEPEPLEPGDDEALFFSSDNVLSLTVYYPDPAQIDPSAIEGLLSEASLEARCRTLNAYQKMFYLYDAPNQRAFISYSYIDPDEGVAMVEYLVGFITASSEVQYLTIAVRQDQHEARFQLIGGIVNSIDVGDLREGAEG